MLFIYIYYLTQLSVPLVLFDSRDCTDGGGLELIWNLCLLSFVTIIGTAKYPSQLEIIYLQELIYLVRNRLPLFHIGLHSFFE